MLGLRHSPVGRALTSRTAALCLGLACTIQGCELGNNVGFGAAEHNRVDPLMTASWPYPFSASEFLAAYRRVMPESEARALVDAMGGSPPTPVPRNIEGFHLMEGTLDLLAAVSDDLAARVRAYREEQARGAEQSARWRDEWHRKHGTGPTDPGPS